MVDETSVITSRRLFLRAFIEQNLVCPKLSLDFIATAMGYSTSYLHQLFKGEGESIGRYIIRRRLEESARSLRDRQQHGRMISTIAYQWGFKSTAHFTRAFKEHYAVTPREYRALNTNFHCV
jgi:AraC-like DNA-binding protein